MERGVSTDPVPALQFELDVDAIRLLHRSVSFPSREMARGARPNGAASVGTYENFAYGCTIGMFFWTRWAALSHGCCFTPLHAFADNGRLQSYKLVIAICAHGEQSSSS